MCNIDWLNKVASDPIKLNLLYMNGEEVDYSYYEEKLLDNPQVRYWIDQLKQAVSKPIAKIHGSHDYRYENIMGKLYTLGVRRGMKNFDTYMDVYLNFLNEHVKREKCQDVYVNEIYANYDYELIIATFLAMMGYQNEPCVRYVIGKRIDLLYDFSKEKNYEIYVDGQEYSGVKKEWQSRLINPKYYQDSNVGVPTIHDYYLFSEIYKTSDMVTKSKIDVIVDWLFDERCNELDRRYGYFYLPNDKSKAKAVCWKLTIPDISKVISSKKCPPELIQTIFLLSHFNASYKSHWFNNLIEYLETFKTLEGRYIFDKSMLVEQTDGFFIFGKHMGVGEDRKDSKWVEIESTYWMERIASQKIHKNY